MFQDACQCHPFCRCIAVLNVLFLVHMDLVFRNIDMHSQEPPKIGMFADSVAFGVGTLKC